MDSTKAVAPITPVGDAQLSLHTLGALIAEGDLSRLSHAQRLEYYVARCRAVGLDPATQPFDFLQLQGKLKLYANKSCSDQLSALHGIRCTILDQRTDNGIRIVTVQADARDGRSTQEIGALPIGNLGGEALANAMMKAVTKAKRRAVISLCGLGMMDESEIDQVEREPRQVDVATVDPVVALKDKLRAASAPEPSTPSAGGEAAGNPTPARAQPTPAQPVAPRTEPLQGDVCPHTGEPLGPDTDVALPPHPPFELDREIKFGFYKGKTWRYLASGSPNGRRRSYMRWALGPKGLDPVTPKGKPSGGYTAIKQLFDWLESWEVGGEQFRDSNSDNDPNPLHYTDEETWK